MSKILKERRLLGILIIFVSIFIIYSNTFHASWHMDDSHNIVNNRPLHIDNLMPKTLWHTFFAKPGHFGTLYRPVACFTFAVNWLIGWNNPFGYHLVNIGLHGLTAFLIYLVVVRLFQTPALIQQSERLNPHRVALLCALLWAMHPLQTQAVTYIVQRMAQLAAFFYLAAMLFYIKGRLTRNFKESWFYFGGCGLFGILGLMSKENAAMLPLTLMLVEICFFKQDYFKIKTRWLVLISLTIALITYVLGVYMFLKSDFLFFLKGYPSRPFTPLQRLLTESRIIWFYLSQLVCPLPSRLSIDHDVMVSTSLLSPWTTLPAVLGVVLGIGTGLAIIKKHPVIAFGILFFFLNHVVESSIIGLELIFEHRNYLPDIFLFLPVSMGVQYLLKRIQKRGKNHFIFVKAMVVLLVLGLGSGTYIRNKAWRNEATLWLDALTKAPKSARALNTLAINLAWAPNATLQQMDKAIELFQRSLTTNKPRTSVDADIYGNIASIYDKKGEYIKALTYFEKAVAVNPKNLKIKADMAACLLRMGAFAKAYEITQDLVEKDPNNLRYLNIAGFSLLWLESPQEALSCFQKVLHMAPYNLKTLINIGAAMEALGHYTQADWFFKQAIKQAPEHVWARLFLVENQIKTGNHMMAMDYLQKTIRKFSIETVKAAFKTPPQMLPPFSRHLIQSALLDLMPNEKPIFPDTISSLSPKVILVK